MKRLVQLLLASAILTAYPGCTGISDGSAFAGPEFENITLDADVNLNVRMTATITAGSNLQTIKEAGFYYGTNPSQLKKEAGTLEGRVVLLETSELDEEKEYFVKSYISSGPYEIQSEMKSIVTPKRADEYEAVDLGLSVLWAKMDAGAENETETGELYAWGELFGKVSYNWNNYKFCEGTPTTLTKYCFELPSYGKVDGKKELEPADDAATTAWGGNWRMPSYNECLELGQCDWVWTDNYNGTGVAGCKITGPNGNSIFLPMKGSQNTCYWANCLLSNKESTIGRALVISKDIFSGSGGNSRCVVFPVRAVTKESQDSAHQVVNLGLSVNWAAANIGADTPQDAGDSFAWGETEAKTVGEWKNYKYCEGDMYSLTKYCCSSESYGKVDNKRTLESEDDAATYQFGEKWRMPLFSELQELMYSNKCTRTWTDDYKGSGSSGYIITSNVSRCKGNSIFVPASKNTREKQYWSSELGRYPDVAQYCAFSSSGTTERQSGLYIRPVKDSQ